MPRGRPRNIPLEIEVIEMLSRGVRVIEIAAHFNMHRNSVYAIKKRATSPEMAFVSKDDEAKVIEREGKFLEQIELERRALEARKLRSWRRIFSAKYRIAASTAIRLIVELAEVQKTWRAQTSRHLIPLLGADEAISRSLQITETDEILQVAFSAASSISKRNVADLIGPAYEVFVECNRLGISDPAIILRRVKESIRKEWNAEAPRQS